MVRNETTRGTIKATLAGLALWCVVLANPTLQTDTWTNLYPANSCGIGIDPSNPSTIYIGDNGNVPGIYKTTDGGSTWNRIGKITGSSVTDFTNDVFVKVDPKNSNHLYGYSGVRGGASGFWVSTDAGATWTFPPGYDSISKIVNTTDMYGLDLDPTDFNHFLLTYHSPWNNTNSGGIVESFDGGKTCIKHDAPPGVGGNGGWNAFFLFSPKLGLGDNKTWIYMTQTSNSTDGWYRTTDAGAHWSLATSNPMIHGGNQIYYAHTGVLYAGSANTLMRSSDNGASWQSITGPGNISPFCVWGDGQNLYSGGSGYAGSTLITSSETDGGTWKSFNTQTYIRGPFKFAFDSLNGIMYGSLNQAGLWALRVNKPNTGIVLTAPGATPSSVMDNAPTSVTLSITATAQAGIASVVVDLTQIGGGAAVAMAKGAGNTYSTTFTIQSGAAPGAWHLPVVATDNNSHTLYGSIYLPIIDHTAPVLVSLNKPVVVSSTQDATTPGSAAVDGTLSTRWASAASDPQWIYVDLESAMTVNRVALHWETAFAKSYEIQVSNDATNWTDVYSTTTGAGGTDSLSFASTSARYIRMYATQRGTTFGYSLYEFSIYSPGAGATVAHTAKGAGIVQRVSRPALVISQMSIVKAGEAVYNVKGEMVSAKRVSQQALVVRTR